jgi:small nuclear ribonucleoprotein (snRNP)-like protein
MASSPGESAGYHSSILHDPVDVDDSGPVAQGIALLRRKLRLSLKDDRVFVGTFTAFDKFGNFVLTDAEESFRDQIRKMPMVIIPLNYVETIDAGPAQPADESE